MLENYVLAESPADRKKLRDSLIPGSETQLYLHILDSFKAIQENPAHPIPDDLQASINTYAKKYGHNQQMFRLREKLLRYDRADEGERKRILDDLARNDLHLTSAWNFQPPAVKKVVGQEQEKQKLPSKAEASLIPSKSELVARLHSSKSNFTNVDQVSLLLIEVVPRSHRLREAGGHALQPVLLDAAAGLPSSRRKQDLHSPTRLVS